MKWLNPILTVGAFAALYFLEKKRPLRKQIEPKPTNAARDLVIAGFAGLAINIFEKPVTDKMTAFVERKRFGLLKIFRLPRFVETVAAVVLLDYTLYLWHVLTHRSTFLWRFHQIHHADLDLTAATALRFHFAEMTISVVWRTGQILIIGVSPEALKIWRDILIYSILFHHSNLRLPKNFEKKLQKIIVTPRLHGIHHSAEKNEMDSNWSSGLTVWDFLHKTFRDDVRQEKIIIGVKNFNEPKEVTLGKMLAEPFVWADH